MEVDNEKKNDKTFEVLLTGEQFKILSSYLPKGYSLQFTKGHQRRDKSPGKPKKKLFLEEDLAIVQTPQKSQFRKKPTGSINSISERNSGYLGEHATKRPFRDKKSKLHFDQKFDSFNGEPAVPFHQMSSKSKFHSSEMIKRCLKVISQLKRHPKAGPFIEPVDYVALHIPDYPLIIKEPIDLGTIEKYVRGGHYLSWNHFLADVKKVWTNSFTYNAKGSDIYLMTQEMNNYFEKITRDVDSPVSSSNNNKNINELQKKVEKLSKEISLLNNNNRPKKITTHYTMKTPKMTASSEKIMTINEKRILGQNIRSLPPDCLRGVWEIVSRGMPMNEQNKEELEFDIDTLPTKVARDLEKYVKEKLSMLKKGKGRKKGRQAATSSNSAQKDHKHDSHGLETPGRPHDIHKVSSYGNSIISKDEANNRDRDLNHSNSNVARDLAYPEHKENVPDALRDHYNKSSYGVEKNKFEPEDDEISKSSDSSFITDSDDGFPSN